ncbi:hypothetical protein V5O48_003065 [Marasmius crinis-equi]|uniref:BZIP domain-containing protein n=1 Tax=Marasmius crinis-equi TaxID=585013 RepID=A0ABR3FTY1_9AGAR
MSKPNPPPLQMSQIIAADAPLLSPGAEWADRHPQDTSHFYSQYAHYHQLPPSPPISVAGSLSTDSPRMLKTRMSPDATQMCLPTHQLFDLAEVNNSFQAPPSPAPSEARDFHRVSISIKPPSISTALKRSESPVDLPPTTKKRSVGERISTKDFIPPDVTGLSKREARLVKNRAAAFLSRQRKREEFEQMEARVLELEQENARLLALTQTGSSHSPPNTASDSELLSEVESLRAQLAASREREGQLNAELSTKSSTTAPPDSPVKVESSDESNYPSLASSPRPQPPKGTSSAASLGLMVLLCALPSLFSVQAQSSAPVNFSLPPSPIASSGGFDFGSYLPADRPLGWSMNSDKATKSHKLEFSADSKLLNDLNSLDISFDTVPSEDGKIRVRIHPSTSSSSRSTSPGASLYSDSPDHPATSSLGLDLWGQGDAETSFDHSFSSSASSFSSYPSPNSDPFLGVGGPTRNDFSSSPSFSSSSSHMFHQHSNHPHIHQPSPSGSASPSSTLFGGVGDLDSYQTEFGFGGCNSMEYQQNSLSKRRVRIALKSMPETPAQGGEWEVQVC